MIEFTFVVQALVGPPGMVPVPDGGVILRVVFVFPPVWTLAVIWL